MAHFRRFNREYLTTALSACFNFCKFTVDASGDVDVDSDSVQQLYQGKSNSIASITQDSPGNYTVQFNSPYPGAVLFVDPRVHRASNADPVVEFDYVPNSYDNTTGALQLRTAVEFVDGVAATGVITAVANASMADGDYITIDDGVQAAVLYEYDKSGDGVTAGRVQVTVSGASTAAEVAARFKVAIDANQGDYLDVVDNGDGTLTVTHKVAGTLGNNAMSENVTNAGFTVTGLSGGVDPTGAAVALPDNAEIHLLIVELRNENFNVVG